MSRAFNIIAFRTPRSASSAHRASLALYRDPGAWIGGHVHNATAVRQTLKEKLAGAAPKGSQYVYELKIRNPGAARQFTISVGGAGSWPVTYLVGTNGHHCGSRGRDLRDARRGPRHNSQDHDQGAPRTARNIAHPPLPRVTCGAPAQDRRGPPAHRLQPLRLLTISPSPARRARPSARTGARTAADTCRPWRAARRASRFRRPGRRAGR